MSSNRPGRNLEAASLPRHVAIIMDGNGRWARKRLLNRVKGHEKGVETVREIVRTCCELGIPVLTLYAFSTENWQRPKSEVNALMALLKRFLAGELEELQRQEIRLGAIGQIHRLPERVRATLAHSIDATSGNRRMLLNLALSYGGRSELTEMVRCIAQKAASGQLDIADIDERVVADHLFTRELPDPDILIRTSGEMRISNFLLWQLAYTEIFVTPTLWPDFSKEAFIDILQQYARRHRRFGKVEG